MIDRMPELALGFGEKTGGKFFFPVSLHQVKGGTAKAAAAEACAEMARAIPGGFAKFIQGRNRVFEVGSGAFLRFVQQFTESGEISIFQEDDRSLHPNVNEPSYIIR